MTVFTSLAQVAQIWIWLAAVVLFLLGVLVGILACSLFSRD